jgi:hypothetical protein
MGNVLEIPPAGWTEVGDVFSSIGPSNVLVIPSLTTPNYPIQPATPGLAHGFPDPEFGDCASGVLLFHDKNSGWWFQITAATCPIAGYDANGDEISCADYFAAYVGGWDLVNNRAVELPQGGPGPNQWWNANVPGGVVIFDLWTIACGDNEQQLEIEIQNPILPPTPTQPPVQIPPPPVLPPEAPPPSLSQPDPEGDEITNDLCNQMSVNRDNNAAPGDAPAGRQRELRLLYQRRERHRARFQYA